MSFIDDLKKSPAYNAPGICRDMGLLYPPFKIKIELLLQKASLAGLSVMVFETYRSAERQAELFKQGRTKLKTNGMHHFGVAADIIFKDHLGNPSWSEPYKGAWGRLGNIGKSLGLYWGGDWKKFQDCPHHQLIPATHEAQNKIIEGVYP